MKNEKKTLPLSLVIIIVLAFCANIKCAPKKGDNEFSVNRENVHAGGVFSHAVHGSMGLACSECHIPLASAPGDAREISGGSNSAPPPPDMGMPETRTCRECHATDDEFGARVGPFIKNGRPVWQDRGPDAGLLRFGHEAHGEVEIGCDECHALVPGAGGDDDEMAKNAPTDMKPPAAALCADCHLDGANYSDCSVCHVEGVEGDSPHQ